jgi:hypothetical protein
MGSLAEGNAEESRTSLRAKRSNPSLRQPQPLNCFVASLLAMTSPYACGHQLRTKDTLQ